MFTKGLKERYGLKEGLSKEAVETVGGDDACGYVYLAVGSTWSEGRGLVDVKAGGGGGGVDSDTTPLKDVPSPRVPSFISY